MNDNAERNRLFVEGVHESYESKDKWKDHLLEQYKVYLEGAEKISARRQTANSFFVTLNTALVALVSYLHIGVNGQSDFYWLMAAVGMLVAYNWYRLIKSYRDLNSAKYKVIHKIEKKLPISPYDEEWEIVGRGHWSRLYLPFTHIEVWVPWLFLVLHGVVFYKSFPWHFLMNL